MITSGTSVGGKVIILSFGVITVNMNGWKMTRDEIIRMAHKANFEGFGNGDWVCTTEEIERFATLVAAAEREACADACAKDKTRADEWVSSYPPGAYFAAYIRARGQE